MISHPRIVLKSTALKMALLFPSTVGIHACSAAASPNNQEILVEESTHARVVTLNRPRQLNALSKLMIERLKQLYEEWETDSLVSLVIIKGSGRAFCAGGDVAASYHLGNTGQYNLAKEYFFREYNVDYMVGTYRKPHVALLDGITMGGGAGISIHGAFRVATENTIFAMPETALGLHPDVGASYFLSRLPGYVGEYVGLTGARLDGADLLATGLATHFVPSQSLPDLEKALQSIAIGSFEDVSSTIDGFSIKVNWKEKSPLQRMTEINKCFSKSTVEKILAALDSEGDNCGGWYKVTAESLRKASPLSLKLTLRSIREGRHQTLRECLQREYRMTVRCVARKLSNDFYEGTRATLVDKDKNPKWNPSSLELVTSDILNHYFSPLEEDDEELELDLRNGGKEAKIRFHARL